jgi:Fe-S-cluster containining protein
MHQKHARDEFPQLADIYTDIDRRVHAITAARPIWPCTKGCDDCCRRLAQLPEMTAAEWHVLQQGFGQLDPARRRQVADKIQALSHQQTGYVTCPLLDEQHGACLVYVYRPVACRTYGFYVSRDGNRWCDAIQDLNDAGVCDDIILGNHSAIERRLQHRLGEIKSLAAWFEQTFGDVHG